MQARSVANMSLRRYLGSTYIRAAEASTLVDHGLEAVQLLYGCAGSDYACRWDGVLGDLSSAGLQLLACCLLQPACHGGWAHLFMGGLDIGTEIAVRRVPSTTNNCGAVLALSHPQPEFCASYLGTALTSSFEKTYLVL